MRFSSSEEGDPARVRFLQHFWICEDCSRNYSVQYDDERGLTIIEMLSTREA